jgi:V/A-type H+-transporting ATPase subunit E
METDVQVSQLEQALLRQAESLAREALKNAEAARARILAEAEQRIELLEEREILAAKAEAERTVRRRLQAAETKRAAEFDRLRWALTEAVLSQVQNALQALVQDMDRYKPVLAGMLAEAARQLPPGDLVAEVNAQDYERLKPIWPDLAAAAAPGRRVELGVLPHPSIGGVLVRLADQRARLDQTFEARQERLRERMAQVVMERLFASAPDLGTLVHG